MQMCFEPWQQHQQHRLVNADEVLLFELISDLIDALKMAIIALNITRITLSREVAKKVGRFGLFPCFLFCGGGGPDPFSTSCRFLKLTKPGGRTTSQTIFKGLKWHDITHPKKSQKMSVQLYLTIR